MSTHDSRRPSHLLRALRAASPTLWPARLRLTALKASYKAGSYSGHPEDMLDSIDGVGRLIRQRIDGIRPVRTAPEPAVEPAPAPAATEPTRSTRTQREYEELTARCHTGGGPFEHGLDAAQRRLVFMKDLYARGGYMGHPEDMLEDIEMEERRIARLTAEEAVV